jgi:hypothetical protein
MEIYPGALPKPSDVSPFLYPLYKRDERNRMILFGSTILLSIDAHHFMLTAAHVIDQVENHKIDLPGQLLVGERPARWVTTELPQNGDRNFDKLDLAAIRITIDVAKAFEAIGKKFVKIGEVSIDDVSPSGSLYFFTGFPKSRTKYGRHKLWKPTEPKMVLTYVPKVFGCRTFSSDQIEKLDWNPKKNIIAQFDREKMVYAENRQRVVPPDPDGMSGGAIWHDKAQNGKLQLAGIGIEYDPAHKALIGTRMVEMLRLLKDAFPETIPYLPRCPELEN